MRRRNSKRLHRAVHNALKNDLGVNQSFVQGELSRMVDVAARRLVDQKMASADFGELVIAQVLHHTRVGLRAEPGGPFLPFPVYVKSVVEREVRRMVQGSFDVNVTLTPKGKAGE